LQLKLIYIIQLLLQLQLTEGTLPLSYSIRFVGGSEHSSSGGTMHQSP